MFCIFFACFLHFLCVFFASGAPEARRGSGKVGNATHPVGTAFSLHCVCMFFVCFLACSLHCSLIFFVIVARSLHRCTLLRRSWASSRNKDNRRMQASATPGRKQMQKHANPGCKKHAKINAPRLQNDYFKHF